MILFPKTRHKLTFFRITLIQFTIFLLIIETMFFRCDFLPNRLDSLTLCLGLLCVVAVFFVPLQLVSAFELKVGLYDAKVNSGKVIVSVSSQTSSNEKSRILDVGKMTTRSGDSRIEDITFQFSDEELPPNGAFSACAYSNTFHTNQCEYADRHYDAISAGIWIQTPSKQN